MTLFHLAEVDAYLFILVSFLEPSQVIFFTGHRLVDQ